MDMKSRRNRSFMFCFAFLLAFLALLAQVCAAPTIDAQPVQRQVVTMGKNATFSVSASGSGNLSYQWYHNGVAITGGTAAALTLNNVQQGHAGAYRVDITDSNGVAASAPAFLNVLAESAAEFTWGVFGPGVPTGGINGVVSIAAGGSHDLALKSNGTVVAWGDSGYGQCNVPSELSNVVAISAGGNHTLALKSDGTVVAWGDSGYGQCNVPSELSNVVAISAGGNHSLALKSDGTVVAWGDNSYGQRNVPSGLSNVVAVAAGGGLSLALKSDGTVVAWGYSYFVPPGPNDVVAIAAGGNHSLALKSDGTVVAWGYNYYGQVSVPSGLSGVVAIAAGGNHSIALKSDGTVVGWGMSVYDQINFPADLGGVIAIAAGENHSLVLKSVPLPNITSQPAAATTGIGNTATLNVVATGDYLGYQWRKNGVPIDNGTSATYIIPYVQAADAGTFDVLISNPAGTVTSNTAVLTIVGPSIDTQPAMNQVAPLGGTVTLSVAASGNGDLSYQWFHNGLPVAGGTSAVLALDNVKYNDRGAYQVKITDSTGVSTSAIGFVNVLMDSVGVYDWGSYGQCTVPAGLNGAVAIAAENSDSLALKSDGTVVGWPGAAPAGLSDIVAIAAGAEHSLALKADGTVTAWGMYGWGQTNVPSGLCGVVAIAAGNCHSLALKADGTLVGWGWNIYGECTAPAGLGGIIAIAAGDGHSLALKSDGTVVAWGLNAYGESTVPSGLSGVVAIAARAYHSLALKADGTVVAWGGNQLGQSTVPPGLSGVVAIAAGDFHNLALKSDGTVVAWGDNSYGECTIPSGISGAIAIAAGETHSLALAGMPKPSLSAQPLSLTINTGEHATFSVTVSGDQLSYQWRKNGVPIGGATGNSFTISNAQRTDQGTYDVVISNPGGSVTSSPATLTTVGPLLTAQPVQRQVLTKGGTGIFSVSATGTGDLTYQWFHNGVAIAGGTSSVLNISNLKYSDSGAYQVKVTDSTGYSLSSAGHLNVSLGTSAVIAWLCNPNNSGQNNVPAGLDDSVAIAGGGSHCLALKSDGTVVGWGNNDYGQISIPSGLSDVVAIAAGDYSSLALKSDGTVVGWDFYGSIPTGLNGVVAISVNGSHNMVLKSDGTVVEWGGGPLTIGPNYIPIPPGLTAVGTIAAGGSHSLALKSDGTVVAWGDNSYGQCTVPNGLSGVIAIAAGGSQSFALKSDGAVVAWGYNGGGLCTVPDGLSGVIAIAAGGSQSLALKSDKTVVAWGTNVWGMGDVPAGVSDVVAIAGGGGHSLLLEEVQTPVVVVQPVSETANVGEVATFSITAEGNLLRYQWRKDGIPIATGTQASFTISNVQRSDEGAYDVIVSNPAGPVTSHTAQLSFSGPLITAQPAQKQVVVLGGTAILSVSATSANTISYQWYHNGVPVKDGTSASLLFDKVSYLDAGVYQIKLNDSTGHVASTVAFLNVSTAPSLLIAHGDGGYGESTIPPGLYDVAAIAVGSNHNLVLKADGTVVAWGDKSYGQCNIPSGLSNVIAIAAGGGYGFSVALKADGTVVAWGDNSWGQTAVPSSLSGVIAIAAGGNHALALKSDGTVVGWGSNYNGQCNIPSGLSGVVAIAAGDSHSLALKSDGTVVAWGWAVWEQITVPAGLMDVVAIAAGGNQSLALKSDGRVVGWGYGDVSANLSGIVALDKGVRCRYGIKADGSVVSLDSGNTIDGLNGVSAIGGGFCHMLALETLQPPAAVTASNDDPSCLGKVHVTWSPAPGATSYQIFRSTSPTGDKQAISTWQSGNEFYDVPPKRAIPYYYWVVAASDPNNTTTSGFSNSAIGSAALTARDVFSNWMAAQGVSGSPESYFAADRDGDGVVNGLEFAFGVNRQNSEPSIIVASREGSLVVGFLKQADATLPYVDLAIECSTDLQDWSYPMVSVIDTTGLARNRAWYQPQASPAKVFFRLEASLKPDPEP